MMSSMCSMPTLSRIISGVTPTLSCSSGDSCRWVVDAGYQDSDFASPMLTILLNKRNALKHFVLASKPPFTPNVNSEQNRAAKYLCAIGYKGLSENPA